VTPRIDSAYCVGGFTVHVKFSDGTGSGVDLADELYGEIFEPLKKPAFFAQVSLHPEFHTLCWPNGADFAPEFLYDGVQVPA